MLLVLILIYLIHSTFLYLQQFAFCCMLDVTKKLSREVSFGSEDSSSNDSALNFNNTHFILLKQLE